MDLWHHKDGEWVNLDQLVKVVCSTTVATQLPYLYSLRTERATRNPRAGQKTEAFSVTLHMADGKMVVIQDQDRIAEIVRRLKMVDPTASPSREGSPQGTP